MVSILNCKLPYSDILGMLLLRHESGGVYIQSKIKSSYTITQRTHGYESYAWIANYLMSHVGDKRTFLIICLHDKMEWR